MIRIPRASFSHGGTRNRLMEQARGDHVAFLTQDAVPASTEWLAQLLAGFTVAPDVGLVFGPYRPRPGASVSVARELTSWFASFSADGPRIDGLEPGARDAPARDFLGHLGFFTDANGCVARAAWREVPFREIAYAEDHLLAQDMLRAGYAKVYVPDAAVVHSHEYSPAQWLRRSFDEARAVREVYGWTPDGRRAGRNLRGGVAGDWRWARAQGDRGAARAGPRRLAPVPRRPGRRRPSWAAARTVCPRRRGGPSVARAAGSEPRSRRLLSRPCQLQPSAASGCRWWSRGR